MTTPDSDDPRGPSSTCPHAERAVDRMEARLSLDRLASLSPDAARLVDHMMRHDDVNSVAADLRLGLPVGHSRRTLALMRNASREVIE
jgi:hypothetical protein